MDFVNKEVTLFCSSKFSWILMEAVMQLVFVLVLCFHISGKSVRSTGFDTKNYTFQVLLH